MRTGHIRRLASGPAVTHPAGMDTLHTWRERILAARTDDQLADLVLELVAAGVTLDQLLAVPKVGGRTAPGPGTAPAGRNPGTGAGGR